MGLNDKVSAERAHIGFFGLRNAGKSSVVNAVTGQKLSLVSDIKGTTTDPVQKELEAINSRLAWLENYLDKKHHQDAAEQSDATPTEETQPRKESQHEAV